MDKLVYILLIAVCWGCSGSSETEKYQYQRDNIILIKGSLKEIQIDSLRLSRLCELDILDDYLLITDRHTYDHHVNIFDKNTFRYLTSFAYPGWSAGEIESLESVNVDNVHRKLEITDTGKKKIFSYPLDSVFINPEYTPEEKLAIQPNKFLEQYKYIDDTLTMGVITEHIAYSIFSNTVGMQNMNTGELTTMPYTHPGVKRKEIAFDMSLKQGLYAECYLEQNLMTICTLDGKLKANVYGSQNWRDNEEGRINYFQQVAFVGDMIFALYLKGNALALNPTAGEVKNRATRFLVFDLNGDYVATLETRCQIENFCYDEANNRIIMNIINNQQPQFVYFNLDELKLVLSDKV